MFGIMNIGESYNEYEEEEDNSAFSDVISQMKKLHGAISEDWFQQFPPSFTDEHGRNLFTIYLNYGVGIHHLEKFIDEGYEIKPSDVSNHRWDVIMDSLLLRNDWQSVITNLFKHLPHNSAYSLLMIPTRHKFEMFSKLHQSGNEYINDEFNILVDMFSAGKLEFSMNTEVKKWKDTMNKMVKCLKFMVREGILSSTEIETLNQPEFSQNFNQHLFYFCSELHEYKGNSGPAQQANFIQSALGSGKSGMGTTGSGVASMQNLYHTQNAGANGGFVGPTPEEQLKAFVKNLYSALSKEYMDMMLEAKPEAPAGKKAHRGKI